jgi:ElaA protein
VHDVLRLRQEVFVVEQNCVFREIDGRDPLALHVLGRRGPRLVAYARVFPPGVVGEEASIGRVLTDPSVRGAGLGRAVVAEAMRAIERLAPGAPIRLAAQIHLERFYESFGFVGIGEKYVDDGIVHLDMLRAAGGEPRVRG